MTTEVVVAGVVSDNKGLNLPGVAVSVPAMSEKDVADLRWGLRQGADLIALSFVVLLGGLGMIGPVAALLPLSVNVLLVGFEILVAFLQAYVFAILTCIYLHDAVHLH